MNLSKGVRRAAVVGAAMLMAAQLLAAQPEGFDVFIDDPSGHSFDVFPDSPEWKYFRTPSYCYASAENERGVLLVGYDRRRDQGHVAFWNNGVTSYRSADTTHLEIVLINVIPGVGLGEPDRTWGSQKFLIAVNKAGQRVFNAKLKGLEMLSSFSRFSRLAFLEPDRDVVQNFDMTHSARAMNRLRACVPR